MSFFNAIGLWGGLAAAGVAVPVLLHLLSRRRHRVVDWAAMDLLRRALRRRSRQVKLENIWLMLLRCLALAMLAVAMARPLYRGEAAAWPDQPRRTGTLIAIDASFSMTHDSAAPRFEQAVNVARRLSSDIEPGEPVTVVALAEQPRIVLRNVPFDAEGFETALSELKPTARPLALAPAVSRVAELVAELNTPRRRCVLITDGQRRDFEAPDDLIRARLERIGRGAELRIIALGQTGAENLAVTDLEHASGRLSAGGTARFVATVRHFGKRPSRSRDLEFIVDGRVVDRRPLGSLDADERRTVTAYLRLPRDGDVPIEARLGPDKLTLDDARRLVAPVRRRVRVTLIDGDPSKVPYASETDFLQAALRSASTLAAADTLRWRRVNADKLHRLDLTKVDVLMLANVADVPAATVERLRSWVDRGGGLMIYLGDRIDPATFNRRWAVDDEPWLPALLADLTAIGAPADAPMSIEPALPGHRLSRVLQTLPAALIASTAVHRYVGLRPLSDAQVIWRLAGEGPALLVERPQGRGRVLLFASTADRDWTDLPVFPMFPLLVHEAVTHLTTPRRAQPWVVGEPIAVPLPGATVGEALVVMGPDGQTHEARVRAGVEGPMVELTEADRPGFYELRPPAGPPRLVAVNVDTDESDLTMMTDTQWQAALEGAGATVWRDATAAGAARPTAQRPRELWRYALLAAIALLIFESLVGRWSARRGVPDEPSQTTAAAHAAPRRAKAVA